MNKLMTLADFRATGRDVADLSTVIPDCGLEGQAGRVYAGDAFINDGGTSGHAYSLDIYNEGWAGGLARLEAILYTWCLIEAPDGMGISEDTRQTLGNVADVIGLEALADIIAEAREDSGSCAALDDACDINYCALKACDDDHDRADEAIGAVYALVGWNDYASDDGRSNGPHA